MLGSTVLGAINGALGLGLGFGAFTGLASLISTVIGPLGWTALGLFTVLKLGSPNYKKLLPAVVFIATQRALATDGAQVSPATMAEVQLLPPNTASSENILLGPILEAYFHWMAKYRITVTHSTLANVPLRESLPMRCER
jgi:hypothetical protein